MAEQTVVEEWWQGGSRKQKYPRRQEGAEVAKGENGRARTSGLGSREGYKRGRLERKKVVFGPASGERSQLRSRVGEGTHSCRA